MAQLDKLVSVSAWTLPCWKRHRIELWAYSREILLRLHADDPRLDDMLPDGWVAQHPEMVLNHRLKES